MTDNVTLETSKATGDARVAAQTVYDNSKVAHSTHSDVARSIHQVKDAAVLAHKISDDAKAGAHEAVPESSKVGTHTSQKDTAVPTHNASHDSKTGAHKGVSNGTAAVHAAGSEMKKL